MEPNPPAQPVYPQSPQPSSATDPAAQPPKKRRRILSIVLASVGGLIVIFAAIASIAAATRGNSGAAVYATATPAPPTATPAPTATRTLPAVLMLDDGTQSGLSLPFTVRGSTQDIFWSCLPPTGGPNYTIVIAIYTVGGKDLGTVVNETCDPENTSGTAVVNLTPGTYQLNISTTNQGSYDVSVEDL